MKTILIICFSLSVVAGGLKLGNAITDNQAGYLLKHSKKEVFRYRTYGNPISIAINNSLRFIACGIIY